MEPDLGRGGTGRLRWPTDAFGVKVGVVDVFVAIAAGIVVWLGVRDPLDVEARDRARPA